MQAKARRTLARPRGIVRVGREGGGGGVSGAGAGEVGGVTGEAEASDKSRAEEATIIQDPLSQPFLGSRIQLCSTARLKPLT